MVFRSSFVRSFSGPTVIGGRGGICVMPFEWTAGGVKTERWRNVSAACCCPRAGRNCCYIIYTTKPEHLKMLGERAKAHLGLCNYEEAIGDYEVQPNRRGALGLARVIVES